MKNINTEFQKFLFSKKSNKNLSQLKQFSSYLKFQFI